MEDSSTNDEFHRILSEARWRLQKQDLAVEMHKANMSAYNMEEDKILRDIESGWTRSWPTSNHSAESSATERCFSPQDSEESLDKYSKRDYGSVADSPDAQFKTQGQSRRLSASQGLFDHNRATLGNPRPASTTITEKYDRRRSTMFQPVSFEPDAWAQDATIRATREGRARRASTIDNTLSSSTKESTRTPITARAGFRRPTGLRKRTSNAQDTLKKPVPRRPSTVLGVTR